MQMMGELIYSCVVLSNGQLDMAHDELLTESTIMVSVMLANNEIGSIQPLAIIADKAKAVGLWCIPILFKLLVKFPLIWMHYLWMR